MYFRKASGFAYGNYICSNDACKHLTLPDTFVEACEHIWKNRKKIQKLYDETGNVFDFPDYGGMSKRAANSLPSDVVDFVQDLVFNNYGHKLTSLKKKQFMRNMMGRYLCNL
jgi:hypothetical protein